MDILTSGCSFTSLYHPENRTKKSRPQFPKTQRTWSDFLYKKGHNTINIGVPTNSNTNIVRGLIYHGNEMINEGKEFSIIAQFSGPTRHEILVSRSETVGWDEFLPKQLGGNSNEFEWNLTNFTHKDYDKHLWLLTGENFGREYSNQYNRKLCEKWGKYFFSVEEKQLNTLERMYDLQLFCKLHDIPFKIFFMSNNYLELEYFKINENFKHMCDLIDWSCVWLFDNHGGIAEWMDDTIQDPNVRYADNPNDKHPSEFSHEKFVDDVILKWEMFQNA